ncbi:MAG TPA: YaiO family outer membrane beta-barrel protein [Allosphingosinicella sp.]|nr:YaiO family outer membrane beta-barrel protein [Allosphingosinicella sp.]
MMKLLFSAAVAVLLAVPVTAQNGDDELYRQGVAARQAGQNGRAVELLSRAAAARPDDADVQLQFGLALLNAGRLQEAESAFRLTLALAPDYADARIGLARIAQRRGDVRVALAELDRVPSGYPEADALRSALRQPAAEQGRWRLDLEGSYSFLNRARPDWHEASLRIGRQVTARTFVSGALEPSRRFGATDVYGEARIDHRFSDAASGYFLFGATPDADFRPRWQVGLGGAQRVLGGPNPTVVTLDGRQSRFPLGDIQMLNPGIEQYVANGRAWLTGRWINVFDENGRHNMGWFARGDVMAGEPLRLFAGAADAPEMSEGVVIETFSVFGGFSYEMSDRTTLRFSIAHEDRPLGLKRTQLQLGAGFRF